MLSRCLPIQCCLVVCNNDKLVEMKLNFVRYVHIYPVCSRTGGKYSLVFKKRRYAPRPARDVRIEDVDKLVWFTLISSSKFADEIASTIRLGRNGRLS